MTKLVAAYEEARADGDRSLANVDSLEAIAALDRTGDGRLHFFEFLGAMIGAGRIQPLGVAVNSGGMRGKDLRKQVMGCRT